MKGRVLYSCNPLMKLLIQQRYRGDIHYVWCSERCDGKTSGSYRFEAHVPPSSNPADIYRQLRKDVEGQDAHSAKIMAQRIVLKGLAIEWEREGLISVANRDDIVYLVDNAPFDRWRPLIYVVPWPEDEKRLQVVPACKRAGICEEYIISDLRGSEFDIVEL